MAIAPLCLLVMKRLLTLTCILFWVVAGKAESIDQRNFALDTFSPTPNDLRVAEKRVQTYWNKHKAQYGANTRYLAVEAGAILSGDVLDLWPSRLILRRQPISLRMAEIRTPISTSPASKSTTPQIIDLSVLALCPLICLDAII